MRGLTPKEEYRTRKILKKPQKNDKRKILKTIEDFEKEQEWKQKFDEEKLEKIKKGIKAGKYIALSGGQIGIANQLNKLENIDQEILDNPELLNEYLNSAGFSRRKISDKIARRTARKLNKDKKLSTRKEAALGGAISGFLRGEGLKGMAGRAWLWFLFAGIGISAVLTFSTLTIPILLYLNFHYWKSKNPDHSRWFVPMSISQVFLLFFLDLLFFFITIIGLTLLILIITCLINPIDCIIKGLFS